MTHRSLGRRKLLTLLFATAVVALGVTAGSASATTRTFSNSTPITIPDSGPSPPYPSNIAVSGFAGNVQKVTATIKGFTHTHIDDVAILLVGPTGTNTILLGRSGGSDTPPSPIDVTFDQAAPSGTPDGLVASGTFQPTLDQDHTTDPLSAPAPGGPYTATLNRFDGSPANGTWQLYVDDQAGGDVGTIGGGWSLNLTGPVNTVSVGTPTLNKKKGTANVPVTTQDSGNLALSGKGVATISSAGATKSVAVGPGTTTLKVKPKGKTRKKLNETGKAKVKVTITFTPTGGSPSVTTTKLKLKKS
jgi:subtilisin-like proprotein convertase family protein